MLGRMVGAGAATDGQPIDSQDAAELATGPLGFGWSHSYNLSLSANADGTYTARLSDRRTEVYTPDGAGGFTPPYGSRNTLVDNGDGTYGYI